MLNKLHGPFVRQIVEKSSNVRVKHPVHSLRLDSRRQRIQRLVRVASRPKPVREAFEVHLINLIENGHHGLLDDFVLQGRDDQRELHLSPARLWDGLKSVTRSIPCVASASKYSKN